MLPVEPVQMGAPASRSDSARPRARAKPARLVSSGPNRASPCRIQSKLGRGGLALEGHLDRADAFFQIEPEAVLGQPLSVASTHAVPMVGWPANGTSRAGVKIRTRAAQSGRVGGSRNVVSEQFISRAMACISASERPAASNTTASGFPRRRAR